MRYLVVWGLVAQVSWAQFDAPTDEYTNTTNNPRKFISPYNNNNELKGRQPRKFPEGFLFGTSTASYQIEGAWNKDGKSISIWDYLTHTDPNSIKDLSNGDVADNSYSLYKRDVEMMRELGTDYYRFSISWPRILPTSFPNQINQAGVRYYNNLINELLKYNIEPIITLYHWDLPQKLQEMGGWTNPTIATWFGDYARVAFRLFGDRVKTWITINEPVTICQAGYGSDEFAPRLNIKGIAEYMCAKNLLVAHATAYRIYDREFRKRQGGHIAISIDGFWFEPSSKEHAEAALDCNNFQWGQYAHPVFSKNGDWPPVMKKRVAEKSKEQGYARSRLPEFTREEIRMIQGSSDFFGLNHYATYLVYRNRSVDGLYDEPSFYDDMGVVMYQPDYWDVGASNYLRVVPWGFFKLLTYIKDTYDNPPIYITENGFSTFNGLNDEGRVKYIKQYLDALLDAIDTGVDVQRYTIWSLMDNFEWTQGYTVRFGLYQVDYKSPNLTRTPRKSAFVYKNIIAKNALDYDYEPPRDARMTIDPRKKKHF